ncbi:MAG: hypothetical protein ACREBS_11335 [Nitrososphaerales archaeon]
MSERVTSNTSSVRPVLELIDDLDQLRVIRLEIGRMNNKTQIQYLMKKRQELLLIVKSLNDELSHRIPQTDPIEIRIFRSIHRALAVYGRGISESILLSFEYQTGSPPLEIVNRPKVFYSCVEKVFGTKSSRKIEQAILFEISQEFELQLSKRAVLVDAIRMARSSMQEQVTQ